MKSIITTTILCLSLLLSNCATMGPSLSSPAYLNASPENKARIAAGKCGLDMTIDECKASAPNTRFEFISAFYHGSTKYETWRVSGTSPIIYLELKDGIIEDMSEIGRGR